MTESVDDRCGGDRAPESRHEFFVHVRDRNPSSNGRGGQVSVYQGQVVGRGSFGPTTCDGLPHTVSVRVETSGGLFQVGSAEAEAFASVEEGGDIFPGSDLRTVQIALA